MTANGSINSLQRDKTMKYRYFLLTALAVAAIAGCAKNEPAAPNEPVGGEEVRTPAGTSLTAVIHDEGATDKAAVADNGTVTWSKGDALSVYDGSAFQTFTLQGEGGSASGTFVAENPVAAKRVAVYPAGSHSLSGNNLKVNLPASYTLSSVDDANTNVPMIATGDFTTGQLSFKQIGGLFRFTHYTVPPEARKFRFAANGHKINGDFVIDITASEPKLEVEAGTPVSEADSVVTVSFPAPAETVEMSFFIPIPTGAYNNLTISLLDASDQVLWTTTTGSTSGTKTIDIVRKSFKIMPAVGGIKTAEELMELASRFNAGKAIDMYKDCKGEITLRNDIDLTGKTWTPIGNVEKTDKNPGHEFGEVFNGRFKTIDNLVVDGTFSSQYAQSLFGVLAATAVIKNLTLGKNSSITYTRSGGDKAGMTRCAGIVDFARYAGAQLINLTNKANITVNATSGANCWVGGVVADCRADVYNCKNEGNITLNTTATALNKDSNGKVNASYVMGGVIGTFSSVANFTVKDVVNTGTVTNTCSAIKADVGGVIGRTTGGTVSGIINRGIVQTTAGNTRIGGLIGTCAASATYPSANSDLGFFGTLLVYPMGGDVGLIFGTNNATATFSNIKVACTWGRYDDATKRYTIASQEDFEAQVRGSATGALPNTDIQLKGSSNVLNYDLILAASSYGTSL